MAGHLPVNYVITNFYWPSIGRVAAVYPYIDPNGYISAMDNVGGASIPGIAY